MDVKFNLISAILFTFLFIGCGGGDTTPTEVTGDDTGNDSTDSSSVILNWDPPSTYTDNTPFNDLQSHNIYMDSGNGFVIIGNVSYVNLDKTYRVENLSPGTYSFAVTAVDSQGFESSMSQPATFTITL